MNSAQALQLARLKMRSFNRLDGERVASDLSQNEALWISFVFGGFEFQPLLELRDLRHGYINADTLFILTQRRSLKALMHLIESWKADEVGWQTELEHGGDFVCKNPWDMLGAELDPDHALIRVWWD